MSSVGRPAGPAAATRAVVLSAALDLLLSEGYGALTAQRLHQATGVSRSTIYRHWETPMRVLEDLVEVAPLETVPDSEDPIGDLHLEVDRLCDRLRDKPVAAFLAALVAAARVDPVGRELRQRYVEDVMAPFRRLLGLAELDGIEIEEAVSIIVAPLLVDTLLLDRAIGRRRAHDAVDRCVVSVS